MRKQTWILGFTILIVATTCVSAGAGRLARPGRFAPTLDRDLAQVTESAGRHTWAAWSYRNGAEFDIAVTRTDERGAWSEPMMIGLDDDLNQTQPVIAVGATGELYLAYKEGSDGRIVVNRFDPSSESWGRPLIVSRRGQPGHSPALQLVAGHLVVAFQTEHGTEIRDLKLAAPDRDAPPATDDAGPIRTWIVDSGDPFGATDGSGKNDDGDEEEEDTIPDADEHDLSTLRQTNAPGDQD